jgi:hypothetical protein
MACVKGNRKGIIPVFSFSWSAGPEKYQRHASFRQPQFSLSDYFPAMMR